MPTDSETKLTPKQAHDDGCTTRANACRSCLAIDDWFRSALKASPFTPVSYTNTGVLSEFIVNAAHCGDGIQ